MQLKPSDFERVEVDKEHYYLGYKKDNIELCLEPCLDGFDVALYENGELLYPKECTKMGLMFSALGQLGVFIAITEAVSMANGILLVYLNSKNDRPTDNQRQHRASLN